LLRRGQDKLRNVLPGGSFSGTGILLITLIAIALWLSSGIFQVAPDERGLVMRFGKFNRIADPGLSYHLPYPVESVEIPKVTRVTAISIGVRLVEDARRGTQTRDVPEESLMLTGDENIVDVDFTVFWLVAAGTSGVTDFRFNMQNPEGTVKAVAESAMREVIGRSELEPVLTGGRQRIETEVHDLVQKTLDQYKSGITVSQVQMLKVEAPAQVIDAFRDVQAAQADQERVQNEARTYAGRVVPEARGRAAQLLQSAEAYREQTVAEATGQTARFNKIYDEYKKAPDVTRQRLYLETMERLFGGTDKIILDSSGQGSGGVVPYLPLPELRSRPPAQPSQATTTGGNR
jgi:membrane protease subunit HflK